MPTFWANRNLKTFCVFLTSIVTRSTMIAGAARRTKHRWDRRYRLSSEEQGCGDERGGATSKAGDDAVHAKRRTRSTRRPIKKPPGKPGGFAVCLSRNPDRNG